MAFLAPIAPFLAIAGAGVQAVGALQEGNFRGQVARNNAQIADQNADYSLAAGQQQAAATSMKGAARGAAIKTAQAAGGIDVNTGSAVDVQTSDRMVAELDAETVLNNAELQAYGYRTQSADFIAQGQQAETAGMFSAASGLLGSLSSVGWPGGGAPARPSVPAGMTMHFSGR